MTGLWEGWWSFKSNKYLERTFSKFYVLFLNSSDEFLHCWFFFLHTLLCLNSSAKAFFSSLQWRKFYVLHCSEENSIFFIAVKKIIKSQIFLHCNFFSILFLCLEQPVKFKKAICSFIFLFFQTLKFFLAVRKYFKMVHSGVKMGPRTL